MLAAKRLIDLALAAIGLVLVSPILLVAGSAVWLSMGRPVVFRQERAGLHGRPFTVYKLRTMRNATGPDGQALPDAERLTRVGRVLRKLSIDELPQLWNVMNGEMSLVGPRPLYVKYIPRYTQEQARRLEVQPGITGWAQVNGRNAVSWDERFRLDVWYVDHWSPSLDVRIILLTLWKVVRREGITEAGEATMTEFGGPSPAGGRSCD